MNKSRPYVIYTDFGNDLSQGSVKAAIDRRHLQMTNEDPTILHECKDVEKWSIPDGALHSVEAAKDWKHRNPVHVGVVDPTVGFEDCERIGVDTETAGTLIGPNNGIFGLTINEYGIKYAVILDESLRQIPRSESNTFDGRDLFAPAAAEVANGELLKNIGAELPADKLRSPEFRIGQILHGDDFGNLKVWALDTMRTRVGEVLGIKDATGQIHPAKVVHHHSDASNGDIIILPGSSGLVEIWVVWGNAREKLGYAIGDAIQFEEKEELVA